jgi:hypothetical protein
MRRDLILLLKATTVLPSESGQVWKLFCLALDCEESNTENWTNLSLAVHQKNVNMCFAEKMAEASKFTST